MISKPGGQKVDICFQKGDKKYTNKPNSLLNKHLTTSNKIHLTFLKTNKGQPPFTFNFHSETFSYTKENMIIKQKNTVPKERTVFSNFKIVALRDYK